MCGKDPNKTERIRSLLREHGALTGLEIAGHLGLKSAALVGALLKNDLHRGAVVRSGDRYSWNEQFDQDLQKRLAEAAALLRRHGYEVT